MIMQLYGYLTKSELLSNSQFDFRKFHLTATALLHSTSDWHVNFDMFKNVQLMVVLIDLIKAFDTVDHKILLRTLELYRIKGHPFSLVKLYLSNRNKKYQIQN